MLPLRVRLTGPATRFAYLLRDFGHFDETELAQLFVEAAGEAESSEERVIDLPTLRQLAARQLFARGAQELSDGEGILAEDWPLLFS